MHVECVGTGLGVVVLTRFIPTCVGTTDNLPLLRTAAIGSSPRAWGLRQPTSRRWRFIRFIPTCVGTTDPATHIEELSSVHPHVRGDYACRLVEVVEVGRFIPTCVGTTVFRHEAQNMVVGSSPRAWGLRFPHLKPEGVQRFIPTCVGTTAPTRR